MTPLKPAAKKDAVDLTPVSKWSFGLKVTIISTVISVIGIGISVVESRIKSHERMASMEAQINELRRDNKDIKTQLNMVIAKLMESNKALAETKTQVKLNAFAVAKTTKTLKEVGVIPEK